MTVLETLTLRAVGNDNRMLRNTFLLFAYARTPKLIVITHRPRSCIKCSGLFGPEKDLWYSGPFDLAIKIRKLQYGTINGCKSSETPMRSGVPQGTIPDHLLFLLHINDLPHCLSFPQPRMHADDTSITHAGSDIYLHKMLKWIC